jgi:hypothetical protein
MLLIGKKWIDATMAQVPAIIVGIFMHQLSAFLKGEFRGLGKYAA